MSPETSFPDLTAENFNSICRICLRLPEACDNIFSDCLCTDGERCYDEMLLSCTLICVSTTERSNGSYRSPLLFQCSPNDGLPTKICLECAEALRTAFEFNVRCERSDKALRKFAAENRTGRKRKRNTVVPDEPKAKINDAESDVLSDGGGEELSVDDLIEQLRNDEVFEDSVGDVKMEAEEAAAEVEGTEALPQDESQDGSVKAVESSRNQKFIKKGAPYCADCDLIFAVRRVRKFR